MQSLAVPNNADSQPPALYEAPAVMTSAVADMVRDEPEQNSVHASSEANDAWSPAPSLPAPPAVSAPAMSTAEAEPAAPAYTPDPIILTPAPPEPVHRQVAPAVVLPPVLSLDAAGLEMVETRAEKLQQSAVVEQAPALGRSRRVHAPIPEEPLEQVETQK